jgi:FtsZ-binding cell division protein ZapB
MDADTQEENELHGGVNRLVAEIDRAVDRMEHLRGENADLKQRNQELGEKVELQEKTLSELRAERDRLRKVCEENASLIENKEEIQQKIEAMLSRLDAVDTE